MRKWGFIFLFGIVFVLIITSPEPATGFPSTPPTFSKTFSPDVIAYGGTSTLTFTIDNTTSPSQNCTGLNFTDNLPNGVVVASPSNASTTCTGGTLTAVAGSGVISYTGGIVAVNSTCTVQADVTSSSTATHDNTSGDLTSTGGNSGTASDSLIVGENPAPTVSKITPTEASMGATVVITGTKFTGTEVKFGGTNAASFKVDSATQITAVVGAGSTGKVTVKTNGGTGTSAETFTYNSDPPTLATGTPSSYQATVTKVEMFNGTSWVEIFSGNAPLDMVTGGTFQGVKDLNLAVGTYSKIRVTLNATIPVLGMATYGGDPYYTTATAFMGQANQASEPTTVEDNKAAFTFTNPAGATHTFDIDPAITVNANTDYQPTLSFTISNTVLLKGTAGNPTSYFLTLDAPTVRFVEP